jgi:hypothetical protein
MSAAVRHDGDDLVRDADGPRSDDQELDLPLDDNDDAVNRAGVADDETDEAHAGSHRADGDEGRTAEVDRADATEPVGGAGRVDEVQPDDAVQPHDGVEPVDGVRPEDGVQPDDEVQTDDEVQSDDEVEPVDGVRTVDEVQPAQSVDDAERVDEPGAEQRSGTTTTYGPDGTTTTVDGSADEQRDLDEAAPVGAIAPVGTRSDETGSDGTGAHDTGSEDTRARETGSDETGSGEAVTDAEAAPAVPVGAADAATAAKPDPSASPVGDRLFTDGDSFSERLRDIALNFVDNPKEATQQAGALVDEAIDKVTTALKSQKDALAGEGADTEKLRVELRGYRDILKRISSL